MTISSTAAASQAAPSAVPIGSASCRDVRPAERLGDAEQVHQSVQQHDNGNGPANEIPHVNFPIAVSKSVGQRLSCISARKPCPADSPRGSWTSHRNAEPARPSTPSTGPKVLAVEATDVHPASSTFPRLPRRSTCRCASAAAANGKVASMSTVNLPAAIESSSSARSGRGS